MTTTLGRLATSTVIATTIAVVAGAALYDASRGPRPRPVVEQPEDTCLIAAFIAENGGTSQYKSTMRWQAAGAKGSKQFLRTVSHEADGCLEPGDRLRLTVTLSSREPTSPRLYCAISTLRMPSRTVVQKVNNLADGTPSVSCELVVQG